MPRLELRLHLHHPEVAGLLLPYQFGYGFFYKGQKVNDESVKGGGGKTN